MNAHHGHKPDFGHHGDVDQTFMAKDSFNVVDIHDNGSHNSFGAPGHSGHAPGHDPAGMGLPNPSEGAGAITGALNQGAHQFHDAATHAPGVGPAASHVVPEHLPSPEQAPAAVTGVVAHGPEQLHAAAASLPAVGPVASHLPADLPTPDHAPAAVTGALSHGPEQLHDAAAGLPGAGPVASALPSHLPGPGDATSHLSSLAGHGPAGGAGCPDRERGRQRAGRRRGRRSPAPRRPARLRRSDEPGSSRVGWGTRLAPRSTPPAARDPVLERSGIVAASAPARSANSAAPVRAITRRATPDHRSRTP